MNRGIWFLAQAWPARPVKIIDRSSTDSTSEMLTLMVAQKLSDTWGQSVVLEN